MDQGRPDLRDADPLRRTAPARAAGDGERDGAQPAQRRRGRSPWRDPAVRGIVYQVAVRRRGRRRRLRFSSTTRWSICGRQNIATGFGFLDREAAFGIGETLIAYSPGRHLCPRLSGRADQHALRRRARHRAGDDPRHRDGAGAAVEQLARRQAGAGLCRDLPQHPAGAAAVLLVGAAARERRRRRARPGSSLPGVFVSNRGIVFPVPVADPAYRWMALALRRSASSSPSACCALGARGARPRPASSSRPAGSGSGLIVGLPRARLPRRRRAAAARCAGAASGFNFTGGTRGLAGIRRAADRARRSTPAAFIAEIVRAGILAVSWGQSEAAMALGLRPGQRMRLVVLPQALRVIVPPMTSQYLSLTKNSSLAVHIGYPDLVSIANTTMNQTGQAVEGIAMIMAVYLVDQPADLAVHEPLQPRRRAGGALSAMTDIADETAGRRPSGRRRVRAAPLGWLRANLFNSVFNTILTLLAV